MKKKWAISLIGRIFLVLVGVLVFMGQRGCENMNNLINEQLQENEDNEKQIPVEPPIIPPIMPNKSDIVAEVLDVERGDFPQTLIMLKILESKNVKVFRDLIKPGETIKASPCYSYDFTSGQIIFTHPKNVQNFAAYYLLPKDRISAIAEVGVGRPIADAKGGFRINITWWVTDIERIAEQRPVEEQLQDNEDSEIVGEPSMPMIPNKSDIVAEVLNVERGDFPQTLITLKILESKNVNGFHNLLEPGEIMKASPHYIHDFASRTLQIIFTHPQNVQNFVAYYLLPKDRISAIAKVKARIKGGNGKLVWWVTDIERIAEWRR